MQPSTASSGKQLSCCLLSLHFLLGILRTSQVYCLFQFEKTVGFEVNAMARRLREVKFPESSIKFLLKKGESDYSPSPPALFL